MRGEAEGFNFMGLGGFFWFMPSKPGEGEGLACEGAGAPETMEANGFICCWVIADHFVIDCDQKSDKSPPTRLSRIRAARQAGS